jgi:hypothetical protein
MKSKNYKIGALVGMLVLVLVLWGTVKMLYLKHYGERTVGVVESVYKAGSKGHYRCKYSFEIGGDVFHGKALYSVFEVGDSIKILYSSYNANISAPEKMVLEYY